MKWYLDWVLGSLTLKEVRFVLPIILLIGGFVFLRSLQEERWSRWAFGDAQTLMAVENWREEGFLATAFLWIPQGYSHLNKWFDEPEFSHHAHGSYGIGSKVGPKRIYTHYPSWYAVPYGLLGWLGVESKWLFQSLAITVSLSALWYLFLFLRLELNPFIGGTAVLLYALSPGFLGYCDSLATMPWADLTRFAFFYYWKRYHDRTLPYRYAWVAYFFSCLLSLDGVLFLSAWAVYSHIFLYKRRISLQLILLAGAPWCAFSIMFLQNASYLGLEGAIEDWRVTFLNHQAIAKGERVLDFWERIDWRYAMFERLIRRTFQLNLTQVVIFWGLVLLWARKSHTALFRISLGWLICGGLWSWFFPQKEMDYQIRQLTPFLVLLLSVWINCLRHSLRSSNTFFSFLLMIGLIYFAFPVFQQSLTQFADVPSTSPLKGEMVQSLKEADRKIIGEKIYFHLGDCLPIWLTVGKHPQVHPVAEYHAGGPVLSFQSLDSLHSDYQKLWALTEKPMVALFVLPTDKVKNAKVVFQGQLRPLELETTVDRCLVYQLEKQLIELTSM